MRNKIALGLAGSGIALGIALALLRGLALNRTVGRPLQLETQLQIPLMLSIPVLQRSERPFGLAFERFTGKSRSPQYATASPEIGALGGGPFHSAIL